MKVLKVLGIIIGVIVLMGIILFAVALIAVNNTANADYYTFGDDQIPSLKSVVGKRTVQSTAFSTESGVDTKTVVYKIDGENSVIDDVNQYYDYLVEKEDFYLTDYEEDGSSIQISKESKDDGQIIIMTITIDDPECTIFIKKGEGNLTIY